MSLAVLHTFASAGSVTLTCYGQGSYDELDADDVVITAIEVGAIN
jgi:hypothetical protein